MSGDVELELRATIAAYEKVLEDIRGQRLIAYKDIITDRLEERLGTYRSKLSDLEQQRRAIEEFVEKPKRAAELRKILARTGDLEDHPDPKSRAAKGPR